MRVLRRAALVLACAALLGACGKSGAGTNGVPDGGPDGGDAAPAGEVPLFNVFPLAANVWPGSFADVKVFFQSPPGEAWHLALGPVTGGAQVTLDSDTLDAAAPATLAHVDVPTTSTGMVTFMVTATSGARTVQGLAEIGILRSDAATMPGYAVTAQVAASPDPAKARFKVRVLGYGGFEGRVYLAALGTEGYVGATIADESVMVSGTTPAETTVDEVVVPGTVPQLNLFAAWHTHVEVANVTGSKETPTGTYVASVPQTIMLSPGETQEVRYALLPLLGLPGGVPSLELSGAHAGFSLGPKGLTADAAAPPGISTLPVAVRQGTVSVPAELHVSVVPTARAGWSLVGSTIAGRDCGGAAVSALGLETVTFGTAARCRFRDGTWTRLADDGSSVWTLTRGTVRYEARQNAMGQITLNVVDLNPAGNGTRFWQVVDEKGSPSRGAPTAAVDDSGQWWLAFADQFGRARAFRKGTVGAGVPASDGLPTTVTSGGRPVIASGGAALYLAWMKDPDGTMQVYATNRGGQPPTWSLLSGLTAPVDLMNAQYAMDVDAQQRPVLAWVGADGKVHVARNAGAWEEVAVYTPRNGLLAFDLAVVADRPGGPLVGWRVAAHPPVGPVNAAVYPARTSGTAIELRRGTMSALLEPSDPRSPITAFSMTIDENDVPVVAEVEGPVTQVLRWVGGP